ncbi:gp24 [Listeria phage P40]|uniref:gp24 n=1 Tax=Listeria phage P40 TaxID=560178 RepID=UPI00018198DE|nr:gp24 [Listeria phage P40]ACI00384.1 gp24 [Listeria phage P40]
MVVILTFFIVGMCVGMFNVYHYVAKPALQELRLLKGEPLPKRAKFSIKITR